MRLPRPWADSCGQTMNGFPESDVDKAVRLQNGLIAAATGGSFQDFEYRELRSHFMDNVEMRAKVPDMVRRCSDVAQFWGVIKYEKAKWHERREIIWGAFRPFIDYLEARDRSPAVQPITDILTTYDAEHIQVVWQKALDRRASDPEGAITMAKSLLESVCKHVLDDAGQSYGRNDDLPKLWAKAAEQLKLLPSQHEEEAFKAILGNSQAVVNGIATIRNRVGDAHGQGRNPVRPKARHAELVVNLAGSMAAFMIATLADR